MKLFKIFFVIIFCNLLPATYAAADPVAIIVHKNNLMDDVGTSELVKIFRGERTRWRDGQKILPINRTVDSDVRRDFFRVLFNTAPESQVYRREYSSADTMVAQTDQQVIELVAHLPNAVGYLYANKPVDDRVKVLSVGGFSPKEPGYALK